jgi:uncharacterized lipoprotein NlpE involved in copper resistance
MGGSMKKVMAALAAAALLSGFFACKASRKSAAPDFSQMAGSYAGQIPGADVSEIDVVLMLNEDGTYLLRYYYIEKDDSVRVSGSFTFKDDRITLDEPQGFPPYYKAGKDSMTQLDFQGNEITGDLAEKYVLKKIE